MIPGVDFPGPVIQIITILVGIVVLISGRKLFWLTVAGVGFITGLILALTFLEVQSGWVAWLIALIAGGIGLLLAVFLQKVAVTVAGFFMGGYVLVWLLQFFTLNLGRWEWIAFIIGGVIGAILASSIFEIALIGLSSLVGATLIVGVTNFSPGVTALLFFVLLIVGIIVQSRKLNPQAAANRNRYN